VCSLVIIMKHSFAVDDGMLGRKRSVSDDESEPRPKRRYNGGRRYEYEMRLLVQSQVRNITQSA